MCDEIYGSNRGIKERQMWGLDGELIWTRIHVPVGIPNVV